LSGCGYSRAAQLQNEQNAYQSNHPINGFVVQEYCEGACLSPDVSNSVSPSGRDIRYVRSYNVPTDVLYTPLSVPTEYNPSPSQWSYYLSARSEIEWDQNCPETRQGVIDKTDVVLTVTHAQLALLIFSILSFIVLSVVIPIIICKNPEFEDEHKWKIRILKILSKLATLTCTIVSIVFAYASLSFWDRVNGVRQVQPCSDPLTDETFRALGDIFEGLSYKNAISTAFSGFAGILEFVEVCVLHAFR